jgi:SAM-dependent methyltransferase
MGRNSVTDSNPWKRFAESHPYFYIDTGFDRDGGTAAIEDFYAAGAAVAQMLVSEVDDLLPGRSVAVEIGCGIGRVLLGHARAFERVRGVDVAPRMLAPLAERAATVGLTNVDCFSPSEPWDQPASADYAYSCLVFQHIEDAALIADYVSRIGRALRPGGVAQLQFDTRPPTLLYQMRRFVPDTLLAPTQRRGIRRIRRDPAWIRRLLAAAGLELLWEREPQSESHWFVARRGDRARADKPSGGGQSE